MGLDVTAYSKLEPAPDAPVDGDGYPVEDGFVRISEAIIKWTEEAFPGRSAPVKAGVYRYAKRHEFRAGSYSGYGEWRHWLARLVGWTDAKQCWDNPKDGPFVELINFADNEGVIGSVVSAKLARDFAEHETAAKATGDDWEFRKYQDWKTAFELAADAGAVDFQ